MVVAGEQEFELQLEPGGSMVIEFAVPTNSPGKVLAPLIKLGTPYPLGIWNTHHLWAPKQELIVWPRAEVAAPALSGLNDKDSQAQGGRRPLEGGDGFSMLRPYRTGDGIRRVAWRVYAKTDGRSMVTRLGEDSAGGRHDLWIEEAAVAGLAGVPARVARLAAWVQQAHASGTPYGLRAFGTEVEPSSGQEHLHRCLDILALAPGHRIEVAYGLREWA